jgi:signal transduction histidine kinase
MTARLGSARSEKLNSLWQEGHRLQVLRQNFSRYTIALGFAVLAVFSGKLLAPVLGNENPYHTVWLAVMFPAFYCGIGPAIVTVFVSAVGVWYWLLPPYASFKAGTSTEVFGMVGFLVFSAVIVALGGYTRRIVIRRERAEEALKKSHEELEKRVRQRTAALEEKTAALERSQNTARSLSGRILTLQDEERRRMARGLHDSLGQYLTALKMNLDRFASEQAKQAVIASESSDMVEKCLAETRTISHLLHPPLLDECGFASAAAVYIEGFSRRSGIGVEFDAPSEVIRLHPELELTLFRTVQEALTNVHKHASATAAIVSLKVDGKDVHLEISDNGRGIPQERLKHLLYGATEVGVGLAGMRERVRQLNGSFEIRSNGKGTVVAVTTPRVEPSPISYDSTAVYAA